MITLFIDTSTTTLTVALIKDGIVLEESTVSSSEHSKHTMPEIEKLYDLAEFYKVFGDCTRIRILYALFESEMCVCDIAVSLSMTKSAISHQLKYLKDNNLIRSEKIGKIVFYSLADKHVKDIFEIGLKHIREGL